MRSSRNFPATSQAGLARRWQISHPRLCLWPSLLHADRLALMGGPKAYPWEASVDTPRLPPFRQDCVRRNRDQRLQRGQGADASRRPVPVMDRESPASHASDVRHPKTKISGPKWAIRNEPLDQSGPTKNIYWAQSGRYWTRQSELPICRGTNVENTTLGRNGHEVVTSNLRFHPG